jgi:hypothetical protein
LAQFQKGRKGFLFSYDYPFVNFYFPNMVFCERTILIFSTIKKL